MLGSRLVCLSLGLVVAGLDQTAATAGTAPAVMVGLITVVRDGCPPILSAQMETDFLLVEVAAVVIQVMAMAVQAAAVMADTHRTVKILTLTPAAEVEAEVNLLTGLVQQCMAAALVVPDM